MPKEKRITSNEARGMKDKKQIEETLNAGLKRMRMRKARDEAGAKGETKDGATKMSDVGQLASLSFGCTLSMKVFLSIQISGASENVQNLVVFQPFLHTSCSTPPY